MKNAIWQRYRPVIWFWWHSYFLAYFLFIISKFCRFYHLYFLWSVFPSSKCSTRISPWSSLIHTPLSSFISDSSVSHPLIFTYDTQLFIFFRAPKFSANVLRLQNKINLVSQWMTANLLSLNQSKTEFLLIGLYLLNYLKSLILLI